MDGRAFLEASDGTRWPLSGPRDLDVVAILSDAAVRRFLQSHGGLDAKPGDGEWRVSAVDLRDALERAAKAFPSAPEDVLHELASRNLEADVLYALAGAMDEGAERDCDVVVADRPLRAVPAPERPLEVVLGMDHVASKDAPRLLAALDALIEHTRLSSDTLRKALIPLLRVEDTAGMAARLLGRAGIREAVPTLMETLSKTRRLDNRLAILGALMHLGQRALGLRTLRSILTHGSEAARLRAVETMADVARDDDIPAIREMLPLTPRRERMSLAALLYRLGHRGAYGLLANGWEACSEETPAEEIETLLRETQRIGSQRFVPVVRAYAERETRPWFRARAQRVAQELAAQGTDEAPPEVLLDQAEEAYFSNRIAEALELLETVVELGYSNPRALYLHANCLKEEGRLEDALAACDRALTIDATYWRTHRLRGSLLWDLGRHEESLEAYGRALSLNPVDPYTWYYKGYVLYRLRRDDEALPCLDRALSLKSDSPYIHNQKAFCLERLQRHDEAVRCYQKSLQLRPDDLTIRDYLGQAMQASGRLEDALECYDQVLASDPTRTETLYHRADVLYDLEHWGESARAFEGYLGRQPDSYNAWFNRGLCLRFLHDYDAAVGCFKRALTLRPDSVNAQRHLRYCQERARRRSDD